MSRPLRFAGFLGGQVGDAIIATVCCRVLKQRFPDCELTFCVADRYREVMPLFYQHPHIDSHHTWEGYDAAWPTADDKAYIAWRGYDHVFHPMAGHSSFAWYNERHYGQEACARYGLPVPEDYSYHLNQWFPLRKDCKRVVTLSLFPSKGAQMDKGLTIPEAEKLCIALRKLGYTPAQLGGRFEPKLENAVAPSMSILEATTLMLSSALHVTADTGFASIAAGYQAPVLGFYGRNYSDLIDNITQIPPNRNAHYIRDRHPNSVTAELLVTTALDKGLLT